MNLKIVGYIFFIFVKKFEFIKKLKNIIFKFRNIKTIKSMKTKFIFPLILLFFGCAKKIESSKNNSELEIRNSGKAFFSFDKVEYYSNDISKNDAERLNINDKTSLDTVNLAHILRQDDMKFTDELEKYNFKKKIIINRSKLDSLNIIFSENDCETGYGAAACIPVYRDIFIFKKGEKIIGKAKICFGCGQYSIEGTKLNMDNFGQCGDFQRLEKLIQ